MPRLRIAILALALSACISPRRDNRFDPAIAPAADLRVVDFTRLEGWCPHDFGPENLWPSPASVARERCLALDARATSDPRGAALTAFTFEQIDSAGNTIRTFAKNTPNPVFVLDRDTRRSFPIDVPIQFRVRVVDARDAVGLASTSVVLLNSRPLAVPDGLRLLPLHGDAWAVDQPITMTFDGSLSSDADGDPLTYCWRFPDAPSEQCSSSPRVQHAVPVNERGRFIAWLRVTDGVLASDPVPDPIEVDEPALWVGAFGYFGRVDFREEEPQLPASFLAAGEMTARVVRGPAPGIAIGFSTGTPGDPAHLAVATLPHADVFSNAVALGARGLPQQILSGEDGARLYVPMAAAAPHRFHSEIDEIEVSWNAGIPGLALLEPIDLDPVFAGSTPGPLLSALDDSANLWCAHGGTLALVPGGNTPPVIKDDDLDRTIVELQVRPVVGEIWEIRVPNGTSASASAALVRWSPTSGYQEFSLPEPLAIGMRWVNANEFWLSLPHALLLEDARVLIAGGTVGEAALSYQEIYSPGRMAVDPETGTCWLPALNGGYVFRADVDGTPARIIQGQDGSPLDVDDAGAIWFGKSRLLRSFSGSPSTGEAASRYFYGGNLEYAPARVDPHTGGLLVFSDTVYETAADGAHIRTTTSSANGAFPYPSYMHMQLDGSAIWGFDSNGALTYFRVGGEQFDDALVLNGNDTHAIFGQNSPSLFAPAQPQSGPNFIWTVRRGAPFDVLTITTAGVVTTVAAVDPSEAESPTFLDFKVAVLRSDSSLCLATQKAPPVPTSAPTIRLRVVERNGSVHDLATLSGRIQDLETSNDAAGGLCWIAYGDATSTTVQAFDRSGTSHHSFAINGRELVTFQPISRDAFWFVDLTPDSFQNHLYRVEFDPLMLSGVASERTTGVDGSRIIGNP